PSWIGSRGRLRRRVAMSVIWHGKRRSGTHAPHGRARGRIDRVEGRKFMERDSRSPQDCRDQAERCRVLAAKARSSALQWEFQQLASEWDMIADQIEMLRRDRG